MSEDLAAIYEALYGDPAKVLYGRGLDRCRPFIDRIHEAGLQSIIAFGCGHGDELIALSGNIPLCFGIDFALPDMIWYQLAGRYLKRHKMEIQRIQIENKDEKFSAAVAFDVLEHIDPEEINAVLIKAKEVAVRACFVVANMPDVHRLPDGRCIDLHLIQKTPEWWIERIHTITGWKVKLQKLHYPERFGLWCGPWP